MPLLQHNSQAQGASPRTRGAPRAGRPPPPLPPLSPPPPPSVGGAQPAR